MIAMLRPVEVGESAPEDGKRRHRSEREEREDGEGDRMATAHGVLRPRSCRRRERFGGAARSEQDVCGEACHEEDLAAEEGDGERVAARSSVGVDGRHDETG